MQKNLTLDALKQYSSQKNSEIILIALKGNIFDVSSSDFYKKGGSYAILGGHDASINLGKMTHDQQFLNKYEEIQLNAEEQKTLDDWIIFFEKKYKIVGKVLKK